MDLYYAGWSPNLDVAYEKLTQAINLDKNFAEAYEKRSYVLYDMGRFDDAELDALKSIEIFPESFRPHLLLAQIYLDKEDLDKSKEIMSNFGTEKTSLNTREIENHIERVDGRIGTLRVTIGELEAFPNMATF